MEAYQQFEVFTANTRREALSLFHGVSFDMVLCGHWLPDGDGLELLKEFMRQSPRLISVLMTVHGDDLLKQEAMRRLIAFRVALAHATNRETQRMPRNLRRSIQE